MVTEGVFRGSACVRLGAGAVLGLWCVLRDCPRDANPLCLTGPTTDPNSPITFRSVLQVIELDAHIVDSFGGLEPEEDY